MKQLFLTLLLFSCTKYVSLTKDSVGVHISEVQLGMKDLNEVPWKVGPFREQKISQSMTFVIDLPKLKVEDLEYLSDQKGIDAWIIRIISQKGSETQDLGSLYSLFKPRSSGRVSATAATSVSVKIYYAAAYASERFRHSKCPPFSHDKRLASFSIEGDNDLMDLSLSGAQPYSEKSQLIELTPSSFNGGNSLVGKYYAEIAPYDSKNKMIHAPFKRLHQYVVVESEESVKIKGCEGVHPEMTPP